MVLISDPFHKWADAWKFAAEAHADQKISGSNISYLYHLGAVVLELSAAHIQEQIESLDLAITCAILHDVVEDQEISLEYLTSRFGAEVSSGVAALTKNRALAKENAMMDSLQRIRQQPVSIWCVKLADRIANLAPPPVHWESARVEAYRQQSILILESLGSAHRTLAERLQSKIENYSRF